eukprot:SAG31_NODE_4974_length_2824_cov_1.164771_2_plen_96_part_00
MDAATEPRWRALGVDPCTSAECGTNLVDLGAVAPVAPNSLCAAVLRNAAEQVEELLADGADPEPVALVTAAGCGHTECLKVGDVRRPRNYRLSWL